eukprot:TRINITY_DN1769_c0_g1_i2.p1 TRINITY_DN1769_c0_g1~~TRINITY_DN1769_c0_g1_i2.p1  ORF type:complete len:113 (-),score=15.99 TRINITY_DN1769_c0_g1_i2:111-449(-)
MTLSSKYCHASASNGIACMLLADSALGKMYPCHKDKFMTKAPDGYDSTFAVGVIEPNPKENISTEEGYIIPAGKIGPSGYQKSECSCHEHQYIVYKEGQCELKYLLKLKFPT